mgnify:CR=1 FL=1
MQYVLYYFIAVSVIGAIVCIYDKLAAARGWRRVPERTLLLSAAVGGSVGFLLGMRAFHHKTLKPKFRFGVPAILALQLALAAVLLWKGAPV